MFADLILWAAVGAAWRWNDGRGYGPGGLRLAACFVLALIIVEGVPPIDVITSWSYGIIVAGVEWRAVLVAALFAVLWLPRQKAREEFDDMALRWAAPMAALGVAMALLNLPALDWRPLFYMPLAGIAVAALVWRGVHWRYNAPHPWLDSSAVTEAAAGAVAFAALRLASV